VSATKQTGVSNAACTTRIRPVGYLKQAVYYCLPMPSAPTNLKVQYRLGRTVLFSEAVRAHVVDRLLATGRSPEETERLWTAATSDTGPVGRCARHVIKHATDIQITIQTTNTDA
jgi:hypothetical protein